MFSPNSILLGKYEIEERVGGGRFAEVYRARELLSERIVAIKGLRKDVYDENAMKYVLSEFRTMGMLWGHPNVVSVHSIEQGDLRWDENTGKFIELKTNDTPYLAYIVMEFVDGPTLDKLMKDTRLSLPDAINICLDVCSGLKYAHRHRIIHRDVKPQNILVARDGTAKVVDFSIARLLEGGYVGTFAGTSKYMAPEQYDGRYNELVDIYATGLLLFESISGQFPFNGRNRQELEEQKKNGEPLIPEDMPEELIPIIRKALQPGPKERYQTAEDMRESLYNSKMTLYHQAIAELPASQRKQIRKQWHISREDELELSLQLTIENTRAKEEQLKTELDIQRNANQELQNVYEHYQKSKKDLEEVVQNYISETQIQDTKLQKLEQNHTELIHSLEAQEQEKNKLDKALQSARREIGRMSQHITRLSPRAIWIHRAAIAFFALVAIVMLAATMVNKETSRYYERQIIKRSRLIANPAVSVKDNLQMISIPAGRFLMGDGIINFSSISFRIPTNKYLRYREVSVNEFYIDVNEVTNAQYVKFLNDVKKNKSSEGYEYVNLKSEFSLIERDSRGRYKSSYNNYPVIEVSWYGARDYANWAKKRLPTEAEWEKAARGGLIGKKYPWGNDISNRRVNLLPTGLNTASVKNISQYLKTNFEPNGYGVYDMAGNVWEWSSEAPNASQRVLRGGGWDSTADQLRCSYRKLVKPTLMDNNVGFRCAKDVQK